jgi:deoxyribodipyrimidine photo-lyase
VRHGKSLNVFKDLFREFNIRKIYTNTDYEPYAIKRDQEIEELCGESGISYHSYKDQVIFHQTDILKKDGKPYIIYSPFNRKWKESLNPSHLIPFETKPFYTHFAKITPSEIPTLENIGFLDSSEKWPSKKLDISLLQNYHNTRDLPATEGTSRIGVHLRFGTVSIRELIKIALELNEKWLDELIWREFFMMILYHFPYVESQPFKEAYKSISWENNSVNFSKWCEGKTGFPIIDAGMRVLNKTGFMHNRVRMIVANFLTKLLIIDWRWGEKYFADKLLDYELSSNNGNWQWSAGCGCDAAPYFRIFNPTNQLSKFDPNHLYVKKWVPEIGTGDYVNPIIDYREARKKSLQFFKQSL